MSKRQPYDGATPYYGEKKLSKVEALRAENARLRESTLEEAAKAAEGFPKNREWVPGSLYDTLRREVAQDIRRLK